MTHQEFADAVGVSRGAVQQWERGLTAPTRKRQPAVADYMGISVAELMQGTSTSPALVEGSAVVSLDAAIAVLADAIERSPYRGQDNLLGMLAYMGKSPGDEINRQAIAALLQNKQQPDARPQVAA